MNETQYTQIIGPLSARGQDKARYQYMSWEPLKEAISDIVLAKANRKKVQEAIDEGRTHAAKQNSWMSQDIDAFITSWVQSSIELLAKESPKNNPKEIFPESAAMKVFDVGIQKGWAIPIWLDMMKPPPQCRHLKSAVDFAYSKYPEPEPEEPKG